MRPLLLLLLLLPLGGGVAIAGDRDADVADSLAYELGPGESATVTLEYHVKFNKYTDDHEVRDGEMKLLLPDGREIVAWVGLDGDRVVLKLLEAGETEREWVVAEQECGILECNEVQGTVNVIVGVDCEGIAGVTVYGYTLTTSADSARIYVDGDARVTDSESFTCGDGPSWALLAVGAGLALLAGVALLRRG